MFRPKQHDEERHFWRSSCDLNNASPNTEAFNEAVEELQLISKYTNSSALRKKCETVLAEKGVGVLCA